MSMKTKIEKKKLLFCVLFINPRHLFLTTYIKHMYDVFVKFVDNLVVKPKFKLILLNYISF